LKTYRFISDPGHGWLEVPMDEIKRLKIEDKISSYSYRNKGKAYLEEDCDFSVFAAAKEKLGEKFEYTSVYQANTPIRHYDRF